MYSVLNRATAQNLRSTVTMTDRNKAASRPFRLLVAAYLAKVKDGVIRKYRITHMDVVNVEERLMRS
jgi:hypothetical protein